MDRGLLRIVRSIGSVGVALLAPAASHAQPAGQLPPWMFHVPVTAELGYTRDDNANHGRDSELRLADDIFSLTFSQPRDWLLGSNTRLEVTAQVAGDKHNRYSGLGRISAGVEAQLQYRASGAFDAVTWSLVGRAAYDEFDSSLRSGGRYFWGVGAQRAFTDRIEMFAEAGRNERDAKSGVFTGRDDGAKVTLVYSLDPRDVLYLTGQYRKGDTVSTGGPSLVNVDLAKVIVPDDAFGMPLISYRFDARTVLSILGWNHAFGPRESIDVSWRWIEAVPADDPGVDFPGRLRYTGNQYAVVYLRRF